jgi:hypothetical protein
LPNQPSAVNAIAFSDNCSLLATGSQNGTYRVWDVKEKQILFNNTLKYSEITNLLWEPRSQALAVSNSLGELNFVDPKTRQVLLSHSNKDTTGIVRMLFSPFERNLLLATSADGSLSFYSLGDKLVRKGGDETLLQKGWKIHTNKCTCLGFSSQFPSLVLTGGVDQRLNFFDIKSNKVVNTVTLSFPVTALGVATSGDRAVLGGYFGELAGIDLRKPKEKVTSFTGHDRAIVTTVEFYKGDSPKPEASPVPTKPIQDARALNSRSLYQPNTDKDRTGAIQVAPGLTRTGGNDDLQGKDAPIRLRPIQGLKEEDHQGTASFQKSGPFPDSISQSGRINLGNRFSNDARRKDAPYDSEPYPADIRSIHNTSNTYDAPALPSNPPSEPKGPVREGPKDTRDSKNDSNLLVSLQKAQNGLLSHVASPGNRFTSDDKEELKDFVRREINNLRLDIIKEMEIQKIEFQEILRATLIEAQRANKKGPES